jgi:hypothetical protein
MDNNQARIVGLLREVHLIAFNEIERLNLRIIELENQNRQPVENTIYPYIFGHYCRWTMLWEHQIL